MKKLIMEHMECERERQRFRKVEATIKTVKEAGGVDSSTFWEVKRQLMGNTKNEVLGIIDENGVKQEGQKEVRDVYRKYFEDLLKTTPAWTEEEKKREELVTSMVKNMERVSKTTKPDKTDKDDVKTIVRKLNPKKAGDSDKWCNEMV